MRKKERATGAAPSLNLTGAKLQKDNDLCKVYQYFLTHIGTSLECAFAIDRLRNSVTWYIDDLEQAGHLMAIRKGRDPYTGHLAKFYTADKSKWPQQQPDPQLSLFDEKGGEAWG